jgi:hypothetical protein
VARERPPLTVPQILAWADAHRTRTGCWPTIRAGSVAGARREAWWNIDEALRRGRGGLAGGDSLARLLARERGRPNPRGARRPLAERQVVTWARAHRRRTGRWPHAGAGAVADAPGEHWRTVESALRRGSRGLPGGDTLARLLDRHRAAQGRGRPVTHG